jgi:hypothetical protein
LEVLGYDGGVEVEAVEDDEVEGWNDGAVGEVLGEFDIPVDGSEYTFKARDSFGCHI